ncbi:MAG: alpha/beta fold hydrolase, partial [Bacteroidota bacterium]
IQFFCHPRRGRLRPDQKTFLASAEATFQLQTKHGTIQGYTWNPKASRSLLLLHGWESNAARWGMLIPYLTRAAWCVHAIDAPAHGASSNELFDMIQYADAIAATARDRQPQVMIGHSVGGATLAYYLSHYAPEPLDQVILMGLPISLRTMIQSFQRTLGMNRRSQRGMDLAFENQFQHSIDYFSTVEFCSAIPFPTLLIHDRDDQLTPLAGGMACYEALPHGENFLTEGFGHSLQDVSVYQRIIDYLDEGKP